jgi:hypothetical protein
LTVVFSSSLPSVEKVDVALRESCDFDQPVRLTSADDRAELVDVALRDAWVDADIASRATERIAIDQLGDCISTRPESHWDSRGEWRKEEEQNAKEHGD